MPSTITPNLLTILKFSRFKPTVQPRPKKISLAMKPIKNTIAIEPRISPSRKLFFFCSGVMAVRFVQAD
jgi:hypothetical protein